jgi:hypothetical protein
MGDMMDYAHSIDDLLELLTHEEEIMECLRDFGYI